MITTLSPQIRLIALVGLLAAAALVVSTQLVFRGVLFGGESEPAAVPANVSSAASKADDAAKTKTQAGAKAGATKAAANANTKKAAGKSTTPTAAKAKPAPARPLETHGLPLPVAQALQRHRVVVVSIFTRKGAIDGLATAEAEAGAKAAGAGFVALNALERSNAEPLAAKLGVLKAPSVLVYTRPAKLFVKLDSFADLATVAQAAANARA